MKLVNTLTYTVHLSERYIKKTTLKYLNSGKISIYDIGIESLIGEGENLVSKYVPRGYKVIITHNEKSKILIYNT